MRSAAKVGEATHAHASTPRTGMKDLAFMAGTLSEEVRHAIPFRGTRTARSLPPGQQPDDIAGAALEVGLATSRLYRSQAAGSWARVSPLWVVAAGCSRGVVHW